MLVEVAIVLCSAAAGCESLPFGQAGQGMNSASSSGGGGADRLIEILWIVLRIAGPFLGGGG